MTTTATTTFETRIDIDAGTRKELVELLNQQLADATDLFTQTKQAHWNVKGMDFFSFTSCSIPLPKCRANRPTCWLNAPPLWAEWRSGRSVWPPRTPRSPSTR